MPAYSVFQNTWQGNQKQYLTPRTNLLLHSDDITNASWVKTAGVTDTALGVTGPDGLTSAGTLVYDGVSGVAGGVRASQALAIPAVGTAVAGSIWLKAAGALSLRLNTGFGFTTVAVTTGWQEFRVPGTADGIAHAEFAIASPAAVNTAFTVDYAFAQVEEGVAATGSYIGTTTAPVTVTDYAFATPPTHIVFATAPITGSVVTGVYADATVFAIGTGDGTTTTFAVPSQTEAPLPVPSSLYGDGIPSSGFAITPSDSALLEACTLAIYVGGSGAVTVVLNRDTATFTFQGVAGQFYELAASKVMATGTAATGIVGLR